MEGAFQIATGTLRSFSEQQLVSCSTNGGNAGCSGGEMTAAMQYVLNNGGIDSEKDYPYLGLHPPLLHSLILFSVFMRACYSSS